VFGSGASLSRERYLPAVIDSGWKADSRWQAKGTREHSATYLTYYHRGRSRRAARVG